MSKGKQWWPMQATVDEQRKVITDFQQRLRDRQWVKKNEVPLLMHIHAFDGAWNTEHLPSVNEYMQISTNDPMVKNQGRVVVARLLCMLLKWHQALRPNSSLLSPPTVFTSPNLSTGGFHYGIVALIQGDPRRGGGNSLTLMVSDFNLSPTSSFKGRHWVMPHGSDSFRWLTTKQWGEQKLKPSFGKWIYGSYTERRVWLEHKTIHDNLTENGLIRWSAGNGNHTGKIAAIKLMGGLYVPSEKSWFLPEFWDNEAVRDWLNSLPADVEPTTKNYRTLAQQAVSTTPPPPEIVEEDG